jgi:hypothetical protein
MALVVIVALDSIVETIPVSPTSRSEQQRSGQLLYFAMRDEGAVACIWAKSLIRHELPGITFWSNGLESH